LYANDRYEVRREVERKIGQKSKRNTKIVLEGFQL
jgi:hypothetical protein